MDLDEFNQKLEQIEEQAQLTLAEFPKSLTKERQRMIIALVRYIRAEAERSIVFPKAETESEAGTRLRRVLGPRFRTPAPPAMANRRRPKNNRRSPCRRTPSA